MALPDVGPARRGTSASCGYSQQPGTGRAYLEPGQRVQPDEPMKGKVENGKISEYRVTLEVTFILE